MISDFDFSVLCCHAWEDSIVLMDIAHVGWIVYHKGEVQGRHSRLWIPAQPSPAPPRPAPPRPAPKTHTRVGTGRGWDFNFNPITGTGMPRPAPGLGRVGK